MWSIDLFPEYSIAMLKPGGRSYDFKKEFFYEMKKTDLKIITQEKIFLNEQIIKKVFLHTDVRYITYLTSDYCELFLVKGVMPHETLYNLKHNLRKKFGVENKVENFIHSTDPGNEYSKFLSCFFSDAIYKYSNCVDMDVEFTSDDLDYFVKCILKLEKNTNLKYIAVNLTNHSPEFANAVVNSKFKRIEVIGLLECCVRVGDSTLILANYFDSKNFSEIFRITKLLKLKLSLEDFMKIQFLFLSVYIKNIFIDDFDLQNFYSYIDIKGKNICENVRKLKCYQTLSYFLNQVHVDGLFCFSPITTLIEGELKMELCEMFHLKQGGGSCMEQELGKFTISLEALLL